VTWAPEQVLREEARGIAEAVLSTRGFSFDGKQWRGKLVEFTCSVELTDSFPFALPKIRIDRSRHTDIIAHVDAKGTVCFADSTNILIDASNPGGLVEQALDKASTILAAGEAQAQDIAAEFNAYWENDAEVCSICDLTRGAHAIVIVKRTKPRPWYLAADSIGQLNTWLERRGIEPATSHFPGVVVPLISAPTELLRPRALRVRHLCRVVRSLVQEGDRGAVTGLLRAGTLPALVVFTFPVDDQLGAIGVMVRAPEKLAGRRGRRFKLLDVLTFALADPVERVSIGRADGAYLLPRGGASVASTSASALVVGVGAVGGWVAQLLAAAGLGRLNLIDNDTLSRDNVHRHVLGMESVGLNKAEAMARHLNRQFPHQQVAAWSRDGVAVLSDGSFDSAVDFAILATGNETLELRLSAALRRRLQLVHVWLDPFDLGFHVFVDGHTRRGCLRCLFSRDERHGLFNRASFLEKGQPVTRSLAGCSGNFTPYTVRHALESAMAAVQSSLVLKHTDGAFLESRFCSAEAATRDGFRLSRRADLFKPGEVQRSNLFGFDGCEVCGVD
jgi:molybdopterin-synthase adenylyltransferase